MEQVDGTILRGPIDPKDFALPDHILSGPSSGDIDLVGLAGDRMTKVKNQLRLSSCVANASAECIELCNALQGNPVVEVSRLQIYFDGRSVMSMDGIHNESGNDGGMYIRAAFQAMSVFGICPEADWPYISSNVNIRPDIKAVWRALKNKLKAYYRVQGSGADQLKQIQSALRAKYPVVIGLSVTNAFQSTDGKTPLPAPSDSDPAGGGHGVLAVGCDGDNIRIRNSWGEDWGDGGHALLSPEWFLNNVIFDPWAAELGITIQ